MASFVYGPFGRRVSKTVYGVATGFLYDGPNVTQELSGSNPSANLLTGGLDEIFTRTDSTGVADFLRDGLGSTAALTDSTGAIEQTYTYDPFGATTSNGGSANSYQYIGRETDATGLYYFRARYYDPTIDRFISEDPVGFAGGNSNLYSYAFNNPINLRDPSGKDPFIGATTGTILGGFYGAWGAWTTGGNGKDIVEAALLGGIAGGVVGAFDPTFGVAVVLGGAVGAGTDALGQWITNRNHHTHCYNGPEILGAGIGGALGGATGWGLGAAAKASDVADPWGFNIASGWSFNFGSQFLSGAPGYAGTVIGSAYGDQGGGNSGQGLAGRKDAPNAGGCR